MNMNFWLLRRLIRGADTGEFFDLAGLGLLVETLGVALLGFLDGHVDENFDEGQRGVGVLGVGVEFAGELAVGFVGGDEGGEGDGCGVGEEFGDLLRVGLLG